MRRRLRARDGFTLIEVMVAALIIVIGFTALAAVLVNGQAQASGDVQESQLVNAADAKIEQIRAQVQAGGFTALALAAAPLPTGSTPGMTLTTWANPNSFLQSSAGCGTSSTYLEIEANYDSGTAANPPSGLMQWANCGTDGEPLEVLSGGSITSGSGAACADTYLTNCTVAIGAGTATVYTFVTDTYVPCNSANTLCPTTNAAQTQITGCPATAFPGGTSTSTVCADARRVVVAVVPPGIGTSANHQDQRVTPVYLSTLFTSPTPTSGTTAPTGITLGASL